MSMPLPKRFIAASMPLGGYSSADLHPSYMADLATIFPTSGHSIFKTNLRVSPGVGSISRILSSSLNPFLPKLNLLRGLDCPIPIGHADSTWLGQLRQQRLDGYRDPNATTDETETGYLPVPTIDQVLAYAPSVYASTPTLRSVVGYGSHSLGQVIPGDLNSAIKYVGGPSTPKDLFNALFGPTTPPVAPCAFSTTRPSAWPS